MGNDSLPAQLPKIFEETMTWSPDSTFQLVESLLVVLLMVLARAFFTRVINARIDDPATRYRWRKNISYLLTFIAVMVIGRIWFEGIGSLATFLGLLSAGIAIALREPLTDLAGWLFILSQKTFAVGDRIQVGGIQGDVIDIRAMKFTLLEIGNWVDADQSTGRVVHLPNHRIFNSDIFNYTADFEFIWNEIGITVTFESDWRKAKGIIQQVADESLKDFAKTAEKEIRKATQSYLIHFNYLTPNVYTSVVPNGVRLTLRYLTHPRTRRSTTQTVWEQLLDRFNAEENIDFAYPTTRFYTPQAAMPE
jgi:small-conductance mechanosensitive channel